MFDVPRDAKSSGLVWFLSGEAVRSLGPEHAMTESGQVFDRLAMPGGDASIADFEHGMPAKGAA